MLHNLAGVYRRFRGLCKVEAKQASISSHQSACCLLACSLVLLFILMMEVARTSETSVNTYQTARRHIAEDSIIHSHRHEKF
jgi:hypothetical protein